MNGKRVSILIIALVVVDQLLKIWVKTHMTIGESIVVFPDWFRCGLSRIPVLRSAWSWGGPGANSF